MAEQIIPQYPSDRLVGGGTSRGILGQNLGAKEETSVGGYHAGHRIHDLDEDLIGGSMIDEATGRRIINSSDDPLRQAAERGLSITSGRPRMGIKLDDDLKELSAAVEGDPAAKAWLEANMANIRDPLSYLKDR